MSNMGTYMYSEMFLVLFLYGDLRSPRALFSRAKLRQICQNKTVSRNEQLNKKTPGYPKSNTVSTRIIVTRVDSAGASRADTTRTAQ
jgi:hypothetical protein